MREQFLVFLDKLMENSPEVVAEYMTDDVKAYINAIREEKTTKPELTDNGKLVLRFLQENQSVRTWKAKDVADQLGVSSRGVSGSMRKLVNDGFCEKIGESPVIYCLTEKGINYKIIEEE